MIAITLKLQNTDALDFTDALSRFINQATRKIRKGISNRMRQSKSGRVYLRGKGQGFSHSHRASAPGEAPASDTGAYERSLSIIRLSSLESAIETNLVYPELLEEGTPRIKPRPMWGVVVDDLIPELEQDLVREIMR